MRKYNQQDQRSLALWAADCAKRVLPLFQKVYPEDERPKKAIAACRIWIRTGVFKMSTIRGASLAAHAAARGAKENAPACLAARAAGQAVATAHVTQHAFGASYYALEAAAAADPVHAGAKVIKERNWQSRRLPKRLRQEIMHRIIVRTNVRGILIRIKKGKDF